MKRYNGDSCRNARIKIDYRGIEPEVRFSYPRLKDYTTGSMLPFIFFGWAFLLLVFVILSSIYFLISEGIKEDTSLKSTYYCNATSFKSAVMEDARVTAPFFLIILIVFTVPPCLIYFPFKKKWRNIYPKFQSAWAELSASCYIVSFKSKDFEGTNKNYLEIPWFENVFLKYKATKDFSKYLDYFEIREYPVKRIQGAKHKKRQRLTDLFWYARFYFKQTPKSGKLEVKFK